MKRRPQESLYNASLFDEFVAEETGHESKDGPQSEAHEESEVSQRREAAELQIRERQKVVDYNIKDYPVDVLVSKFSEGQESDENEFFIPYYQRDFTWDVRRQSRFIESILLGLPIPPLFLAGLEKDIREDEGRLEIVDGSQRIRTLELFLKNLLKLRHLEKLALLNGCTISDLELSRQRKFRRHLIRVIELSDRADEETRRDLFERINTGSDVLKPIEVRRGAQFGPFFSFLDRLAADEQFKRLVPVGHQKGTRKEGQELLLRFFAYYEDYEGFKKRVDEFLTSYIERLKDESDNDQRENILRNVLAFVDTAFHFGFRKGPRFKTVPRVRFEAIAVGTALALKECPDLDPLQVKTSEWVDSDEFRKLTTADGSNSAPRLRARIEYVRDKLLKSR